MAGVATTDAPSKHLFTACAVATLSLALTSCTGSATQNPEFGGAQGSGTSAELSNDALLAPPAPVLDINVQAGRLNFAWENAITASRSSLFAFDAVSGDEWLVSDAIPGDATSWSIPAVSHQLPWHSRQYRIELCDADDCVSSLRVALSGQASQSLQTLTPAVSLRGEAFGQSIALNDSGNIAAIAEPLAGSVAIYTEINGDWLLNNTSDISEVVSTSRKLKLAASTSGNRIAAYASESDDNTSTLSTIKPQLLILERLGESWLPTQEIDLSTIINSAGGNHSDTEVYLSGDGQRALLSTPQSLVLFTEVNDLWQSTNLLTVDAPQSLVTSLGVSRALDIIHIATLGDDGLSVQQMDLSANNVALSVAHSLPMLRATPDVQLASSESGDELVVLAWEAANFTGRIPVAWHYQSRVLTGTQSTGGSDQANNVLQLDVQQSRRFSQAPGDAILKLAANRDLSSVTFAWQASSDASLISVVANDNSSATPDRWQPALELPQSAPVFAKSAFVDHLAMSHDGNVLMVSMPLEFSSALAMELDAAAVDSGHVLVLQ